MHLMTLLLSHYYLPPTWPDYFWTVFGWYSVQVVGGSGTGTGRVLVLALVLALILALALVLVLVLAVMLVFALLAF